MVELLEVLVVTLITIFWLHEGLLGSMEPVTDVCLKELQINNFQSNSFLKHVLQEPTKFKKGSCFSNSCCFVVFCFVVIGLHISTQSLDAIVCIGVSTSPKKHHPLLPCQAPPLNLQSKPALFKKCPPLYRFFVNSPHLIVEFFNERPKY